MSLTGSRTTSKVQSMMCSVRDAGSEVGGQLLQAGVALDDAGLHPAGDHAIPGFDGDHVGVSLELERLDGEVVLPHHVEHAAEAVLAALPVLVDVAVAAAAGEVPVLDVHLVTVRSQPLPDQLGLGVRPEQGGDWGVELALDVDERHALGCGDGDRVRHDGSFLSGSDRASSASRLRNCCSWISRYRSIQAVSASSCAAFRCTGRRCASRLRVTSPACSSTWMCLETACLVIEKGSANSLTVAGPRESRAIIRRRTGSARAMKARSSRSSEDGSTITLSTNPFINHVVDYENRPARSPCQRLDPPAGSTGWIDRLVRRRAGPSPRWSVAALVRRRADPPPR